MKTSGCAPKQEQKELFIWTWSQRMLSLRKMDFMHKDIHLFHGYLNNILETIYIKVVFYVVYKIAV